MSCYLFPCAPVKLAAINKNVWRRPKHRRSPHSRGRKRTSNTNERDGVRCPSCNGSALRGDAGDGHGGGSGRRPEGSGSRGELCNSCHAVHGGSSDHARASWSRGGLGLGPSRRSGNASTSREGGGRGAGPSRLGGNASPSREGCGRGTEPGRNPGERSGGEGQACQAGGTTPRGSVCAAGPARAGKTDGKVITYEGYFGAQPRLIFLRKLRRAG